MIKRAPGCGNAAEGAVWPPSAAARLAIADDAKHG